MTVIYESGPGKRHRYRVQYRRAHPNEHLSYNWSEDSDTYRTRLFAWLGAKVWNSIGYFARVVDTRAK